MHQAVEIAEGVPLSAEREVEARITRQRYFGFYDRVAGMTGTAEGNEHELIEFYNLSVVKINRNRPSQRKKLPTRYFGSEESKTRGIAQSTVSLANNGQPVLVGTRTIAQSRNIADQLSSWGHEFHLLNGVQDQEEAEIVGEAGTSGQITIATNMAGRGTDIKLDAKSIQAGGLHVIVAEHHESRRVDRQIIGRCARQADPGSFQFFVSGDDDIVRRYDPGLGRSMKRVAKNNKAGECRFNFDTRMRDLQLRIERMGFAARKNMVAHDHWLESVQKSVARMA